MFGGFVATMNCVNIRLVKKVDSEITFLRYGVVSLFKGAVYGIFFPIAMLGIVVSATRNEREFMKHFVPCSVYGKD